MTEINGLTCWNNRYISFESIFIELQLQFCNSPNALLQLAIILACFLCLLLQCNVNFYKVKY